MNLEYFQLIDRILDLNLGERTITVEAQVPKESTIFEGHFPGYPIMPGVLLIEAMAQTSGWLLVGLVKFERMPFLAAVKEAKDKSDADFQKQQAEIMQQRKQDLIDSEKRTADALAELAMLAAVREEERGLVVTLSGSILFRSAESKLLSSAQVKLDQVANALLAVRARNLIVEGHTDSQGSESYNQGLSERRANAVRDYLVQRGYPVDRIQSRGKGKGSPIANNASPEGRANNRRVEIIIER